jgi:hypothetical protein
VRIFKNKRFAKFAKDEGISDAKLRAAIKDAEAGLVDADYGGGLIKQRIARPNEGKSGGYRTIILYCRGNKAFFVYGFPKNERDNISKVDEREYKELAKITFALSDDQLATLIKDGVYEEIT